MNTQKRQIKFLERSEVRQIIEAIPKEGIRNLRDRALLEALFSTGLRISEALALRVDQLKENTGTQEITIVGKGGWQRTVYIAPIAMSAIRAYLTARPENDPLLFLFGVRQAQLMVRARARLAGLEKRVTPHMFRHSLATDLLRKGVDIRFVSEFLGHRSINNTMIYTHVVNEQLKSIHKKLYK